MFLKFSLLLIFFSSCSTSRFGSKTNEHTHQKRDAQSLLIENFEPKEISTTLSVQEQKDDLHQLIYSLLRIHAGRYFLVNVNYKEKMREAYTLAKGIKDPSEIALFSDKIKNYLFSFQDPQLQVTEFSSTSFPPIQPIYYLTAAKEDKKNKVLYLKLDSFTTSDQEIFLSQLQQHLHRFKKIIFDLRHHWDINDELGLKIARLLHGNTLQHGVIRQHSVYTQESVVSLINTLKLQEHFYPEYALQKQTEINSLTPLVATIKPQRPPLVGVEIPRDQMPYNSRDAFEGGVYFLINKQCSQSCESFILAFTNFPEKEIVGEESQGGILFSRPGIIQLKNSKLLVQIPTAYNELLDLKISGKNRILPTQSKITFPLDISL